MSCIWTSLLGAGRMLMGSGTRFLCFYTWVARLYFVLAIKFHFPLFRLAIVLVCWKYRSGHRQSLTPTRNMLFEGRTPQRSPASTFSSVFFGRLLFGTWLKQLQKASRQHSPLNFLKDWHEISTFSLMAFEICAITGVGDHVYVVGSCPEMLGQKDGREGLCFAMCCIFLFSLFLLSSFLGKVSSYLGV